MKTPGLHIFILLMLTLLSAQANAQGIDSQILQLEGIDLSDQPDIWSDEYNFVYTGSYPLTPLDFSNKDDVFWEPVDMSLAVAQENASKNRNANIRPIAVKSFGFSTASQYAADGQTKVTNIVYKDMRGLQLVSPCPPVGLCWRCAPYRNNRLFR